MKLDTRFITVRLQHEGFHKWKGAPRSLSYLAERHRHVFHFVVEIAVGHGDRAVEFITVKNEIARYLERTYGKEFGGMSCEMIAEDVSKWLALTKKYNVTRVEVLEDGENGGGVTWTR